MLERRESPVPIFFSSQVQYDSHKSRHWGRRILPGIKPLQGAFPPVHFPRAPLIHRQPELHCESSFLSYSTRWYVSFLSFIYHLLWDSILLRSPSWLWCLHFSCFSLPNTGSIGRCCPNTPNRTACTPHVHLTYVIMQRWTKTWFKKKKTLPSFSSILACFL